MLNKSLFMTLVLTSYLTINFAHAEHQTPAMPLTRLDKSKACDLSPSLRLKTNDDDVLNFKIETHQKIKVSLINKANMLCYTFDYEPQFSPFLFYKLKGNKLILNEIMGTFENGNQIETTYKVKNNPLSLVLLKAKHINYSLSDNSKTKNSEVQKVVSDW